MIAFSYMRKKPFLISPDMEDLFSPQLKSMTKDIVEGFQALEDICAAQKRAKNLKKDEKKYWKLKSYLKSGRL